MSGRTPRKGDTLVSPWTGEAFTSAFTYRDHLERWPSIAEANGLNLDGTPKSREPRGLEDLTVAQLRDVADAEGIDLGKAKTKADIVAAIEAARAATVDTGDGGESQE